MRRDVARRRLTVQLAFSPDDSGDAVPVSGAVDPWPHGRLPELVSVVIPVYNAIDTLGAQLAALREQDYSGPAEIVLADNGSTDGLRHWVAAWEDERMPLRVVDAADRRGVSHARNVGCREARGDLIAICDADDVTSSCWLRELVRVAAHAAVAGGSLDGVRLNTPEARSGRMVHDPERLPVKLGLLPYAHGCNLAVWSDVLDAVGGWDDEMLGGEDVDFSWRVQLAGYRVAPAPKALVHYRYRESSGALFRQMYSYAVAEVGLYKRYRGSGAKRRPLKLLRRDLWLLISRLPHLASPIHRGSWVNRAAQLAGRVDGSWRYRTWYI